MITKKDIIFFLTTPLLLFLPNGIYSPNMENLSPHKLISVSALKFLMYFFRYKSPFIIIPSLTLVKVKNGYKPSKYGHCSRFPFCSDMYYIISVLILFALYL